MPLFWQSIVISVIFQAKNNERKDKYCLDSASQMRRFTDYSFISVYTEYIWVLDKVEQKRHFETSPWVMGSCNGQFFPIY